MAKMTDEELAVTKRLLRVVTTWIVQVGLAIKNNGNSADIYDASDAVADVIRDFSRDGDE